jgi:type IV secretory pathway TraG/TraD family ATPase VirD4
MFQQFLNNAELQLNMLKGSWKTIVNNHRAKFFGSGIGDPDTLRYISEVVGQGEFQERGKTAGRDGFASSTEGSMYRDLTPANVVRGGRPGDALLVYGHLPSRGCPCAPGSPTRR